MQPIQIKFPLAGPETSLRSSRPLMPCGTAPPYVLETSSRISATTHSLKQPQHFKANHNTAPQSQPKECWPRRAARSVFLVAVDHSLFIVCKCLWVQFRKYGSCFNQKIRQSKDPFPNRQHSYSRGTMLVQPRNMLSISLLVTCLERGVAES